MNRYDKIMNISYAPSGNFGKLSRASRAAQFAPFAALSGYEEMVNNSEKGFFVVESEYIRLDDPVMLWELWQNPV